MTRISSNQIQWVIEAILALHKPPLWSRGKERGKPFDRRSAINVKYSLRRREVIRMAVASIVVSNCFQR